MLFVGVVAMCCLAVVCYLVVVLPLFVVCCCYYKLPLLLFVGVVRWCRLFALLSRFVVCRCVLLFVVWVVCRCFVVLLLSLLSLLFAVGGDGCCCSLSLLSVVVVDLFDCCGRSLLLFA